MGCPLVFGTARRSGFAHQHWSNRRHPWANSRAAGGAGGAIEASPQELSRPRRLWARRAFRPEPFVGDARPLSRVVNCFRIAEMTVSRTRWSLTGAVWAALILAPAWCSAQPPGETGPNGGSNLTRQTQNEIDIAMPSLAPLVERVMPAVVNISVELKEQAATQGEGNKGNESASPLGPGGKPV